MNLHQGEETVFVGFSLVRVAGCPALQNDGDEQKAKGYRDEVRSTRDPCRRWLGLRTDQQHCRCFAERNSDRAGQVHAHCVRVKSVRVPCVDASQGLALLYAFCLCNVKPAIALATKPDLSGRTVGRNEVDLRCAGKGWDRYQHQRLDTVNQLRWTAGGAEVSELTYGERVEKMPWQAV